jgi:glycosyltransferase involved in cell wall biosynthesis
MFLRQVCFIPDPQLFWLPSALSAARRVRRELPVAAILCSGPPFSVFLMGRLLKTLWRVPLVLDYRDVWLEHPWWPVPAWRRGIEARMERHLLLAADLVVANHEAMLRAFLERNPRIADRSIIVPNGFDPDELGPPARPAWRPGERFEIVYAGTLYGPIADPSPRSEPLSVQRPASFFRALRQLSERRAFGPGGARVVFVGARAGTEEAANLMACARDCGVADMVQVLARMEKSEVIPILRRAHLLLNILYYTEAQVAQKVYEYLHFEIPILSLLRDSEANATIVRQARAGPVVDPGDVAGIVTATERLVRDYAAGRPPIVSDRSFIDRFDARAQARLLDARLRELLGRPRDGALRHDGA